MKTIVVGYDGTEASERALERAGDLAGAFGSTVILASVSPVMTGAAHGGGSVDPTDPPDAHQSLLDAAKDKLAARRRASRDRSGPGGSRRGDRPVGGAARSRRHRRRDT